MKAVEQSKAVASVAPPPAGRYMDLALAAIAPSPTNPRKKFGRIDELAESMKANGCISPITVRPHPKPTGAVTHELVVGERRWRAAKLAKLTVIPAVERELSDLQAIEIQIIENVQRADVHPLEEADGYEELLSKHGYDVEGIAKKTGKSVSYIYARLKLAALADYPRKAFLDDRLSASVALLLARIPDAGLQEKATREVLGEQAALQTEEFDGVDMDDPASAERRALRSHDDYREADVDEPSTVGGLEVLPMSVREAQIHLRRRYMLRLDLATFGLADPQLVPSAGACTTCSYRTGNQRELFAEVSSADVCTNPGCFERKTAAAFEEKAAAAKARGVKVIEKDQTERMFSPIDGRTVAGNSPYVDPKSEVPRDLVPMGQKPPTWEKLLGKKLEAPTVIVQDQTGAARELLDKNAAVKLLRDAGKIDKPLKPASSRSSSSRDRWQEQQERERKRRDVRERAHDELVRQAFPKIAAAADSKKELAQWKWIVRVVVARDVPERAQELLGVKKADDVVALVKSTDAARALLFQLLFAEAAENPWHEPKKDGELLTAAKLLGLDYDKVLDEAKTAAKAADQVEKKVEEKKASKKKGKKR
jgi:ParB/RepB/Spo0J family partition protein